MTLQDDLKAKALSLISQQMANWVVDIQRQIGEHQGNHRLGHRHEAREQTRIVATFRTDRRLLAAAIDSLLLERKAARRLYRRTQYDRHAAADAAEHAAVAIRFGADVTVGFAQDDVVVLAAAHRRNAEAGAIFEPGHGR